MKLKTYLCEIGMTAKEFSELVGIHPHYMCMIARGAILPGARLARDIESLTEGKVKFRSAEKQAA